MRDLVGQIRAALGVNLYYLALAAALILPDICGALASTDGRAKRRKYTEWFDRYVGAAYVGIDGKPWLTGEDCYRLRCSFLHQGTSHHPQSSYSKFLFVEPTTVASTGVWMHLNVVNDALQLDVTTFCFDMLNGVEAWLGIVEGTEPYEGNNQTFIRRYPHGLPPYISGLPVIS